MVKKGTLKNGLTFYRIDHEEHLRLIECKAFFCICDMCNHALMDNVYYVPVLGYGVCPACFDDWKNRAVAYKEDKWFEDDKESEFEKLIKRLDLVIQT